MDITTVRFDKPDDLNDGSSPKGVETDEDESERTQMLRGFGYKL